MDMTSPLAHSLSTQTHRILEDAPEPATAIGSNGVKLVIEKLVRTAAAEGLEVTDDSTSDINQGFIDLLLEGDGLSRVDVAECDINRIMSKVTAAAASNGVRCHFVLRAHVSYTPVEEA